MVLQCHLIGFGHLENGDIREPPHIPLCWLLNMEVVRSLQVHSSAIENLQAKFKTNGYVADLSKFYVSVTNADGVEDFVTDEI